MKLNYQYETGRIYANDDSGKLLAQILFPSRADGTVNFTSTFTDPSLRGQGIADELVRLAIAVVKQRGVKAAVTCSYVISWFEKHPEEADLLAPRLD